jgi:transcriptional regulator with XRE-family HTH domain
MKISGAISTCRTIKELTQKQLADLAGVNASFISRLEKSKTDLSMQTICKIGDALYMPAYLLVFLASANDELGFTMDEKLYKQLSEAAYLQIRKVKEVSHGR